MTNDSERLARMERRQEAVIQGVNGLADAVRIGNAMTAELMAWLKEPPSSELSDAVKTLITAVTAMRDEMKALSDKVEIVLHNAKPNGHA